MARISFMQHFKDGSPTYFKERILSINSPEKWFYVNDEYRMMFAPKLHTIRESKHFQKFVGKELECFYWVGKPRRSKHQVFATVKLEGYQPIKIDWNIIMEPVGCENKSPLPSIYIDGKGIGIKGYKNLIISDGLNEERFLKHFDKDFDGFIYHFTKLRY